jgi:outer membrane protein
MTSPLARVIAWLSAGLVAAGVAAAPAGAQLVVGGVSGLRATPFARDTLVGPALSLEDAERIAHDNNPTFLEVLVSRRNAGAGVRSAYGGLLPQLSASFGVQYQQAGSEILNGISFGTPSDILASSYQLGVTYQLSAATLFTPAYARANRAAADADIDSQAAALRNAVAQQYLTALQAQARSALQDTLIGDAQVQLDLAHAREAVGSASALDTRRAEVALGQQRVDALQARNQASIELLRLFQQLGVAQPAQVHLTTAFATAPPAVTLDSILAMARTSNPDLLALRSRAHAASVGVHRAHGLYAPTLSVNTGIGGYTYEYTNSNAIVSQAQASGQQAYGLCVALDTAGRAAAGFPASCAGLQLTPGQLAQIRASNKQFPFNFTSNPYQVSATVSLPIFDGFLREQQVEQASAASDDARYAVRARELQLTADISAAYYTLTTASQTAQIQDANVAKAREELLFADERYRVGAASFLDVADARASYARVENDRIGAVYDYHKAFAALESAVGRPLR